MKGKSRPQRHKRHGRQRGRGFGYGRPGPSAGEIDASSKFFFRTVEHIEREVTRRARAVDAHAASAGRIFTEWECRNRAYRQCLRGENPELEPLFDVISAFGRRKITSGKPGAEGRYSWQTFHVGISRMIREFRLEEVQALARKFGAFTSRAEKGEPGLVEGRRVSFSVPGIELTDLRILHDHLLVMWRSPGHNGEFEAVISELNHGMIIGLADPRRFGKDFKKPEGRARVERRERERADVYGALRKALNRL